MKESEYNPYLLHSFERISENCYILDVIPYNYDDDYYYQITIVTNNEYINYLKNEVNEYIYVNIISSNELEIFIGKYLKESTCYGYFEYTWYKYEKIEKLNKNEWKSKFYNLLTEFKSLFNIKIKDYELNQKKVVYNYRSIYNEQIKKSNGLDFEILRIGNVFNIIYLLFENNTCLENFNKLINYNVFFYPIQKDWKIEYFELDKAFNKLKAINIENYSVVKTHMIGLYENAFNSTISDLKRDYPNTNESLHKDFFNIVIKKLNDTEN